MTDSSDTPDKPKVTIVSWLARQKEVIVLIMFFVGGGVFLYVNFVTQNQIKVLTCSLGVQVKLLAETAHPLKYLRADHFRLQRQGYRGESLTPANVPWISVSR